jgi:uncharacterized protein (DUF4415 family)
MAKSSNQMVRRRASRRRPRVDLARLAKQTDEEIEAIRDPDIPDEIDWSTAKVVRPAKAVPISIRVDPDVLAWYREEAAGAGYQTLMNRVLRLYRDQAAAGSTGRPKRRRRTRRPA